MSTVEELNTLVKYYFETYGLETSVDALRGLEAIASTTNTQMIELVRNWNEFERKPAIKFPEAPQIGQQAFQRPFPIGEMVSGTPNIPQPQPPDWEAFDRQFRAISDVVGATSNLVHIYYWMESAQERLENAQLRLANAQDTYNNAVNRYGASSQQAISAYRSMEVAENNLERAHAREILNIGLLGIQTVQFIGHIASLMRAEDALTAAYLRKAVAFAMAHPWMAAAVIAAGVGVGAFAYGGALGAGEAERRQRERRGETAQTGAKVVRGGIIDVEAEELILNPNQQRKLAGKASQPISFGDFVINVYGDLDTAIDEGFDRHKWNVKNQLRRLGR